MADTVDALAEEAVKAPDPAEQPTQPSAATASEPSDKRRLAPIVLSNGTLKDPVTGHFLTGPDKDHKPITKANAREMSRLGAEARKRKARLEIIRAAEEHTGRQGMKTSDAYAVIAGEAVRSALANFMDKPRDAVPAAKLGLQMGDMAPSEDEHKAPVVDGLAVTGAGLDFLRDLLRRSAPELSQVIEGEAREVE